MRFSAAYFWFQGFCGLTWWACLWLRPSTREWFFAPETSAAVIPSLAVADLLLFVGASFLTAWLIPQRPLLGRNFAWMTSGAVGYATFVTFALFWQRAATGLSLGLMTSALVLSLVVTVTKERTADRWIAWMRQRFRATACMFRTSKCDTVFLNAARTLAYAALLWWIFLWVLPGVLFRIENHVGIPHLQFAFQFEIAWTMFSLGGLLGLSAAWKMVHQGRGTPLPLDCATRLVTRGVYRFVRNPMAVGGLTQGLAVAIGFGSFSVIAYTLCGMVLWNNVVRPVEECDLERRFGQSFIDYRSQVRCWKPSLHSLRSLPIANSRLRVGFGD